MNKEMNVILVKVDKSCDMAEVLLNGECIMDGNFWDFHPGCHGINEYGDFNSHYELAKKIGETLTKEGKEFTIVKEEYVYEY